ncbi:hypothetical protein AK812_SmicGene20043 [Symbiodinium microadriaticum]|uniref:Uncharacterized protein n=1 Tax=Symbiodinium microadriaticum TaxID=2951 RepID=A0A1Q9DR01_SYMMI|nr:hypothetical protein AK812_SmicGene20043 [Symbiodinium microadriaticum]
MFDRLPPDALTNIASYVAIIELHIGVNHNIAPETTSSEQTWDADLWKTRSLLTEFGSNRKFRNDFVELRQLAKNE